MNNYSQGDIVKIDGKTNLFLIVSNNTFISATGVFHISPIIKDINESPLHVKIEGNNGTLGIALCENILLYTHNDKACTKIDSIPYSQIMNISDLLQGIFEYD